MSRAADTSSESGPARRPRRAPRLAGVGLAPFGVYVAVFLVLPTVLAVGSGLFDNAGRWTLDNVSALGTPVVAAVFWNSTWLSLVTAAAGAVVGALVCWALLGFRPDGALRSVIDAVSGVLAQFGGVMLAFAFIATMGLQGIVTLLLKNSFGIDLYAGGAWIYELPGLVLPYIYFQVPLMVITFMPAMVGLRPQWAEANLALGGTPASFWWRIGFPVLTPSFFASFLLLFANGFSAYGTAAALSSQGSSIVPLQIRQALTSETVLGRANLAGALALGMIVVMAVVMTLYALVQRRAARWQS